MNSKCTLTLMTACTDVMWVEEMVCHLSRRHKPMVSSLIVFVDTAPLGPAYIDRPGVGTLEDLRVILKRLESRGVIDEIRNIDYGSRNRRSLYKKYFGTDLGATHNFRGYPILGSLESIEHVNSDYVLHFDSDMLVHTSNDSNWVKDGISLLENDPEVMFVSPRSGPPRHDDKLFQGETDYELRPSYFAFKHFTSRKYLFSHDKLNQLLPIKPQYISGKRRLWQQLSGRSALWNWEIMVSRALESSVFCRADLRSTTWSLHTPDHGERFVENLPEIIRRVESGWFPKEQAGHYDLLMDLWLQ